MPLFPFIPYPPAKDGYWEPVTSTLNWCEEVSEAPLVHPSVVFEVDRLRASGLLCDKIFRRDRQYPDESPIYASWCERDIELPAQWTRYDIRSRILWISSGRNRQLPVSLNFEV
jgi:hypothetical protein